MNRLPKDQQPSTSEYIKNCSKFHQIKVKVNEATVEGVYKYFMKSPMMRWLKQSTSTSHSAMTSTMGEQSAYPQQQQYQ